MINLSFHGAAREVTGSCYLFETAKIKVLIDCGMFQGNKECSSQNFEEFRFDSKSINAVLVTHAHLDHVGRIPKLVHAGFLGKIYSTAATRELAFLILEDALNLAERENNQLFTREDLEKTQMLWEDIPYYREIQIGEIKFQLNNAGHILGSSMIELWAEGKHFLFTGDLGNTPSVLLPPPDTMCNIEYLVVESTYGNVIHEPPKERELGLERAVEDVSSRRGTLMIPAFATERTQDILHLLNEMLLFKRIPEIPVFVDAPLAIRVTAVYEKYIKSYNDEIQKLYLNHPNLFKFKKLKFTESVEDSKKINDIPAPKVIIAGSGMMSGGRILHHARRYLSDPKSILLVIGYQVAGSLGRRLLDGEELVKLFGEEITVRAEIRKITGFSAHADSPQIFSLIERNRDTLEQVFVVQGEEARALHVMQSVRDHLGIRAEAPRLFQKFEI